MKAVAAATALQKNLGLAGGDTEPSVAGPEGRKTIAHGEPAVGQRTGEKISPEPAKRAASGISSHEDIRMWA